MPLQAEAQRHPGYIEAGFIRVPDQGGTPRQLANFRGHTVVVYFYPKDDTPGCTVEGKEFRDLYEEFAALDCEIVGISTDSVASHQRFAEKHALPFTLLADTSGALAQALGVLNGDVANRSTFVLAADGRIVRTFVDVAARGHAQQVLNFVRAWHDSHRMLGG
jgi:peroxiredoxin Q/BCP